MTFNEYYRQMEEHKDGCSECVYNPRTDLDNPCPAAVAIAHRYLTMDGAVPDQPVIQVPVPLIPLPEGI